MSPSIEVRENREFAAEVKFIVPQAPADQIRGWARSRLSPDPNASKDSIDAYQISSLYFDTEQFDVFHRRGSYGRSKYRIRRYGSSEIVFLERKLKTRGLVTKRRSAARMDELACLASEEPDRHWPGYWFHQRLLARRLRPICQITYRRNARVLMTNLGPIRLTLDQDIRAVSTAGLAFQGNDQATSLLTGQLILELKYLVQMPVLFKQLVEEFCLNPLPVSKYRLAVTALGFVKEPVESVCLTS
jgi:hypothetical protein